MFSLFSNNFFLTILSILRYATMRSLYFSLNGISININLKYRQYFVRIVGIALCINYIINTVIIGKT